MNESHPIDELFRGKLKEYEMSPPMQLWDAIDQRRRRPKPAFWWFQKNGLLLGASLFLIVIAGLFLLKKSGAEAPSLQYFPVYLDQQATTADHQNPQLEDSQNLAILPSLNKQGSSEAVTPSLPSTTNESDVSITNSNDYSTNVLDAAPQVASTPFPSSSEPVPLAEKELEEGNENSLQEEVVIAERAFLPAVNVLEGIAFAALETNSFSDEQADWPVWSINRGNGITLFMEAFGSPGFASRSISPINETFSLLSEEWSTAQQEQSALQFGLRFAAVNRKGWTLRTGFHFTQIRESFDFEHHIAEIAQVYDPDGGFVREDTIFVPSGLAVNSQNEYALIDLPIILGYQKRFQRWTVSAQAGPVINLSFQPKGTLINPNRQLVAVQTPEAQTAFRSSLGINWYAGLGLQYEVQPGVHLMLEPHLRFQRRSFMEDNFPVQQKFLTGGVSVGVRKQIIHQP